MEIPSEWKKSQYRNSHQTIRQKENHNEKESNSNRSDHNRLVEPLQPHRRKPSERVAMVQEYGKDHARLVDHLSLSMAVFTGTKAAKQSLKRSLGLAMVKATNETYSLHFAGDNCTVIAYTARVERDKLSDAWDVLGESVPAHTIDEMKAIHAKAAVALREATKELRAKADNIAHTEKKDRAKAILSQKGLDVNEANINLLVATM